MTCDYNVSLLKIVGNPVRFPCRSHSYECVLNILPMRLMPLRAKIVQFMDTMLEEHRNTGLRGSRISQVKPMVVR